MADFCRDCSIELFGKDLGDLAGLVDDGNYTWVICEGCIDTRGLHVLVDSKGKRHKELEVEESDEQTSGL